MTKQTASFDALKRGVLADRFEALATHEPAWKEVLLYIQDEINTLTRRLAKRGYEFGYGIQREGADPSPRNPRTKDFSHILKITKSSRRPGEDLSAPEIVAQIVVSPAESTMTFLTGDLKKIAVYQRLCPEAARDVCERLAAHLYAETTPDERQRLKGPFRDYSPDPW